MIRWLAGWGAVHECVPARELTKLAVQTVWDGFH